VRENEVNAPSKGKEEKRGFSLFCIKSLLMDPFLSVAKATDWEYYRDEIVMGVNIIEMRLWRCFLFLDSTNPPGN